MWRRPQLSVSHRQLSSYEARALEALRSNFNGFNNCTGSIDLVARDGAWQVYEGSVLEKSNWAAPGRPRKWLTTEARLTNLKSKPDDKPRRIHALVTMGRAV